MKKDFGSVICAVSMFARNVLLLMKMMKIVLFIAHILIVMKEPSRLRTRLCAENVKGECRRMRKSEGGDGCV